MALTYKSAGVNKHEGYNEVNLIKKFIKNTYTKGVLSDLGGFSGLFELGKDLKNPVFTGSNDLFIKTYTKASSAIWIVFNTNRTVLCSDDHTCKC